MRAQAIWCLGTSSSILRGADGIQMDKLVLIHEIGDLIGAKE